MEFSGKSAFITGAGSGIGRATAVALAAAGAKLCITDQSEAALSETAMLLAHEGVATLPLVLDVRDEAEVVKAVAHANESLGSLSMAVNSAGIIGSLSQVGEIDLPEFKNLLEVNVIGLLSCMKAQLRVMVAAGSGSIVNIASAAGLVGTPGSGAYCASKHAVVGLTRTAAWDHGASGVRINAICPAMVETPMTRAAIQDERLIGQLKRAHAVGRFSQPEEIAESIVWLLSDRASFVTGAAIAVDGGFTAI